MNTAKDTFAILARMAAAHKEFTWELQEDAIRATAALRDLISAAEEAACELIRVGKLKPGTALLAAISQFIGRAADTSGVIKGNADLVPATHATLGGDQ